MLCWLGLLWEVFPPSRYKCCQNLGQITQPVPALPSSSQCPRGKQRSYEERLFFEFVSSYSFPPQSIWAHLDGTTFHFMHLSGGPRSAADAGLGQLLGGLKPGLGNSFGALTEKLIYLVSFWCCVEELCLDLSVGRRWSFLVVSIFPTLHRLVEAPPFVCGLPAALCREVTEFSDVEKQLCIIERCCCSTVKVEAQCPLLQGFNSAVSDLCPLSFISDRLFSAASFPERCYVPQGL